MSAPRRILVANAQVPFTRGGAEIHVETLVAELRRRGHECELVTVPFATHPRLQLLRSCLAWRMLDLTAVDGKGVDLLVGTRFPSYAAKHPNKVVWLIHQHRAVYELLGSAWSDFDDSPEDRRTVELVRELDGRTLGEARALFTNSRNTAQRLERFNGLPATPLYPPAPLGDLYREGTFGDYVFSAGRLHAMKRFDHLLRAVASARSPVRCVVAGRGPEHDALLALAEELGVRERVQLAGWVSDEQLAELYAGALAVYYAPYDEDYGYVTVEGFKSGKPVLTCADSGGVLEFARDGVNGFVLPPGDHEAMGARIDELFADRALAQRLGAEGKQRVAGIGWDAVVAALLGE